MLRPPISNVCHLPRNRVIPVSVFNRVFAEVPPTSTIISGADQFNLAQNKGFAYFQLVHRRRAIARWPPGNDIGNVEIVGTRQPNGGHHSVKQLSTAPDKGFAGAVFILSRCFANEHDAGRAYAVGKYGGFCGFFQAAALKALKCSSEFVQRRGGFCQCCAVAGSTILVRSRVDLRCDNRWRYRWLLGGRAVLQACIGCGLSVFGATGSGDASSASAK